MYISYKWLFLIMMMAWVLFGINRTVLAAEGDVTVHTFSVHLQGRGLNNVNPGVGYDVTDTFRTGILYNSYKKPSVYAAYIVPWSPRIRAAFGVVTGYAFKDKRIQGKTYSAVPLVALEVDLTDTISILWFGTALNLEVKFK